MTKRKLEILDKMLGMFFANSDDFKSSILKNECHFDDNIISAILNNEIDIINSEYANPFYDGFLRYMSIVMDKKMMDFIYFLREILDMTNDEIYNYFKENDICNSMDTTMEFIYFLKEKLNLKDDEISNFLISNKICGSNNEVLLYLDNLNKYKPSDV